MTSHVGRSLSGLMETETDSRVRQFLFDMVQADSELAKQFVNKYVTLYSLMITECSNLSSTAAVLRE